MQELLLKALQIQLKQKSDIERNKMEYTQDEITAAVGEAYVLRTEQENLQKDLKMSNWAYRVVMKEEQFEDETCFTWTIREVFFENNHPMLCSSQPSYPMSTNSVDELRDEMHRYAAALALPILDFADFQDYNSSYKKETK